MIDQQVASRVAAYRGNPQALQQRYAISQELIDLLALQKIKSEKEAAARDMQLKMAQQQAANGEAPATVAEQREKEVMDLTKQELVSQRADLLKQQQNERQQNLNRLMGGIANAPGAQTAAQPQAMAAGGIVAFAGDDPRVGSQVPDPEKRPERLPGESNEAYRKRLIEHARKLSEQQAAEREKQIDAVRQRVIAERGGQTMASARGMMPPAAPPAPKPPPAPVVPDSDAAEKADRMTGSVEA
ncbi:MAG: hypothetical protein EBR82_35320, partial [Caulobacteraceae bacterium]|nr:hypothetical protein [Caulobacteraceae bacterium]